MPRLGKIFTLILHLHLFLIITRTQQKYKKGDHATNAAWVAFFINKATTYLLAPLELTKINVLACYRSLLLAVIVVSGLPSIALRAALLGPYGVAIFIPHLSRLTFPTPFSRLADEKISSKDSIAYKASI